MPYPGPANEDSFADRPTVSRWYGWQTLTTDGAALGLVMVALSSEGGAAWIGAPAAYFLGGPIVHLAHGRPLASLGSLGLRVGAPLVGYWIADSITDCPDGNHGLNFYDGRCGVGERWAGLLLGVGAAMALDASVLAREKVRDTGERSYQARHARLSPGILITPERRTLVFSGIF